MKPIAILAAALSVTSAAIVPRDVEITSRSSVPDLSARNGYALMKEIWKRVGPAVPQHPTEINVPPATREMIESFEGRSGGHDNLPQRQKDYIEKTISQDPKYQEIHREQMWGKDNVVPGKGETNLVKAGKDGEVVVFYQGKLIKRTAMNKRAAMIINGVKPSDGATFKPASSEKGSGGINKKSEKDQQRDDQLHNLPGSKLAQRDEGPPAKASHEGWHGFVTETSNDEQKYEGHFMREYSEYIKQRAAQGKGEPMLVIRDNREDSMVSDMNDQLVSGAIPILRGPKTKMWAAPDYMTIDMSTDKAYTSPIRDAYILPGQARGRSDSPEVVDGEYAPPSKSTRGKKKNSKRGLVSEGLAISVEKRDPLAQRNNLFNSFSTIMEKRDSPIEEIQGQQDNTDPNVGYEQDIGDYIDMMAGVQTNITYLIWPTIENVLSLSNSSLIYDMAFSIWQQMTYAPVSYAGPFWYGMTQFDQLEDILFAQNDTSEWEKNQTLALDGYLIQQYADAWANATEAANSTGLLPIMDRLAMALMPANASLLPAEYTTPSGNDTHNYDIFIPPTDGVVNVTSWFEQGDETSLNSTNSTAGNFTRRAPQPVHLAF